MELTSIIQERRTAIINYMRNFHPNIKLIVESNPKKILKKKALSIQEYIET